MRLGLALRPYFQPFLDRGLRHIDFVELTAEHYFDQQDISIPGCHAAAVHSLAMSLGSPSPLDRHYIHQIARVADKVNACWISDHLAFTRAAGIDFGHLNPVPLNAMTLCRIKARVSEIQEITGRRLLLENITSHLQLPNEIPEPEFLNQLSHQTGSGILLDITNLYVNAQNHGFDPIAYIDQLDIAAVAQMHLIGYTRHGAVLEDEHGAAIQQELLDLLEHVIARRDDIPVIIEWDRNFPSFEALEHDLRRVYEVMHGSGRGNRQTARLNPA